MLLLRTRLSPSSLRCLAFLYAALIMSIWPCRDGVRTFADERDKWASYGIRHTTHHISAQDRARVVQLGACRSLPLLLRRKVPGHRQVGRSVCRTVRSKVEL